MISHKIMAQECLTRFRVSSCINIILPLIIIVISATIMLGWIIYSLPLIQIIPSVPPMQFNTALLFLCYAFALLALNKRYLFLCKLLAILAGSIALITLIQYPLKINLGIDTLFVTPFTTLYTSYIGRMAISTACAFIFVSFSLLLFPENKRISQSRVLLISMLISISFAFGAVSFNWGEETQMSVPAGLCFILVGITTISCIRKYSSEENLWLRLPIFISFITIVISVSAVVYTKAIIDMNHKLNSGEYISTTYWMVLSLGLLITCLVTLCIDIAIKSRDQSKALSENKELYKMIVENIEDYAIFMLTTEGKIKSWNKGSERIYGYTKEEALGQDLSIFYTKEDLEKGLPEEILKTTLGRGKYEGEGLRVRSDGSQFMANFIVSSLYDENKKLIGLVKIDHDITKRKEQEAELKASEESFRSAMEYAPIGMALISLNREWIKVNPAACNIVGYSEADLVSNDYRAVTHPEDIYNDAAYITKLLNKEIKSYVIEKRFLHKNGQIILASVNISLAWNADGTPRYFIVQLQDITERRRLEEALTSQAALLQLAHDAIFVRNTNDEIIFWNKGAESTYGWTSKEVIGKEPTKILQTVFPTTKKDIDNELNQRGQWSGELIHIRKDGKKIVVASRWALQKDKDNRPVCVLEINRDITEQKKFEEDLKEREKSLVQINQKLIESEKFQHLITESIPDIIFVKDSEGKIIDGNTSFFNIYPEEVRDKILGTPATEFFSPAEIEHFLKKDREAFENGRSETIETIRYPDGKVRTLHTDKIRFYNDLGEAFIMGIARDITEREDLIQKLLESNTELERFAYVASHDLQEPIRMITSFSRIVASDLKDKLDKEGIAYLQIIEEAGDRMHAIIKDLLDYSRINNESSHFTFFDGAKILASTLENIKVLIEEKKAVITYDHLPELYGNPVQFMRVIQNLIINGIKYQPPEKIPHIHIGIEDEENFWRISVKDDGMGIERKFLKEVFEPFRRLHSWNAIKGTGIGLSICKKIIENHHGRLWVISTPGKGSAFIFTLPKHPKSLTSTVQEK